MYIHTCLTKLATSAINSYYNCASGIIPATLASGENEYVCNKTLQKLIKEKIKF